MAINALSDTFNDITKLTGYDTPLTDRTGYNAVMANNHRNLRIFNQSAVLRARIQSELDNLIQPDGLTMDTLEHTVKTPGETWSVSVTSGATASTFTVDKQAS